MKTARQTAFEILNKIQRDNSYSNLALDYEFDKSTLSQQDKAFASAIVYGVLERRITIDFQLNAYLTQPLKKLKPQVLTAMRMGAYQLLFMDKVPESAAINESVKLVKNNSAAFAAGLTNAVLRKISQNGLKLPDENDTDYFQIKYSVPKWLADLWINSYGKENAIALLDSTFGNVDTVIRVNTLKTTKDDLSKKLLDEGFACESLPMLENALVVRGSGALHKTASYKNGLFHVQDTASQLCCLALAPNDDDTVLDICSAPGGKSFTLAQMMNNYGRVYSFDIHDHRLKLIENGAERLGVFNISTLKNDGSIHNPNIKKADKILCDVPCAGLGVIRKKPEIRYKNFDEVDKLSELQYAILCASAEYLKNDGVLIYSTCSLNPVENELVVEKFLKNNTDFRAIKVLESLPRHGEDTPWITLMPHIHNCDGFFIAALKKSKDV